MLQQQESKIVTLQQAKATAEEERAAWQHLAHERASLITTVAGTWWVRLGLLLGVLKKPDFHIHG